MALHRAQGADWEHLSPTKWNRWQRLAAHTHSIVTPGNIISVIGALLVVIGLYAVATEAIGWGIICIVSGRSADILDGWAADKTGTKSPLGEAVDATIDKVIVLAAITTLAVVELLPAAVIVGIFVASVYMSAESIYAKRTQQTLHPSLTGKLTTAAAWVLIVLYLFRSYLAPSALATFFGVLAGVLFILYLIGSALTAIAYTKQLKTKGGL